MEIGTEQQDPTCVASLSPERAARAIELTRWL